MTFGVVMREWRGEGIERDWVARTGCWSHTERVLLTYDQVRAYELPATEGKQGAPRWPAFADRYGFDPRWPNSDVLSSRPRPVHRRLSAGQVGAGVWILPFQGWGGGVLVLRACWIRPKTYTFVSTFRVGCATWMCGLIRFGREGD